MSSLGETDEVPQGQQEGAIVTLVLGLSEENGGRIQSPQAGGLDGAVHQRKPRQRGLGISSDLSLHAPGQAPSPLGVSIPPKARGRPQVASAFIQGSSGLQERPWSLHGAICLLMVV